MKDHQKRLLWAAAVLFFLAAYILPLGIRPLIIPDETRYAEIPREMIASGNWISPTLDGFRYFEKPVLGYWLNAVSIELFGQNNFAVRLPAALSTGLAGLLVFLLVWRFAGGRTIAAMAAMVFVTCFEVFGIGVFNVLDAPLSMLLTAAMTCFFFAFAEGTSKTRRLLFLALLGVFCGLAFMAKGFLALVIPVIIIVPYMLWQRRFIELLKVCIFPLACAILVALPWVLAIHRRQPDFWHYFFWVEHVQRFTGAAEGQHAKPFWHFLPVILAGAMPWTPLAGCLFKGSRRGDLEDPLVRFCLCWLIMPFVFFSASSGKLETYILPCFAPLAILISIWLSRYLEGDTKDFSNSARNFAIVLCVLACSLVASQTLPLPPTLQIRNGLTVPTRVYSPSETGRWMLLAAALLVYALLLFTAARASGRSAKFLLWSVAPLFLFAAGPLVLPQRVLDNKAPGHFLQQNLTAATPSTIVVSDRSLASAVCWYWQRSDVLIIGGLGELKYGASYSDSKHRLLEPDSFGKFVSRQSAGSRVLLVVSQERYADYDHALPQPVRSIFADGLVIAEFAPGTNDSLPEP